MSGYFLSHKRCLVPHDGIPMLIKYLTRECLGEQIGDLLRCLKIRDLNPFLLYELAHMMVIDLYVSHVGSKRNIVTSVDCRQIVIVYSNRAFIIH
jgi:hypothetical protein